VFSTTKVCLIGHIAPAPLFSIEGVYSKKLPFWPDKHCGVNSVYVTLVNDLFDLFQQVVALYVE